MDILYFILLISTLCIVMIHGCKRTVQMLYKPFGPRLCSTRCQDSTDVFYFLPDDLACHRVTTNNSADENTRCYVEENSRVSLLRKLDVCKLSLEKRQDFDDNQYDINRLKWNEFSTPTVKRSLMRLSRDITLHEACKRGNLCMVQFILSQNITDINTKDKKGRTPVMLAGGYGQVAVFDYLVSRGCDLSEVDKYNDTVLHIACMGGYVEVVRTLVEHLKHDIESIGAYGWTPVMTSAYYGHTDVFSLLQSKGCNLRAANSRGDTVLQAAILGGELDMVKYIISKQIISLKIVDSEGNNIFATACRAGYVDVVKYLYSLGEFSLEGRDRFGRTPVMVAVASGKVAVVEFLVSKLCKVDSTDSRGNNILHLACIYGDVDTAKYILQHTDINVERPGELGRKPVMIAAVYGNIKMVEFLLSLNCKLADVDSHGNNILHNTCIAGHLGVIKFILSHKDFSTGNNGSFMKPFVTKACDGSVLMDSAGVYRRTPVMFAANFGHTEVVQFLVQRGCDMRVVDFYGCNILHVACERGRVDVVAYLLTLESVNQRRNDRNKYGQTPLNIAEINGHGRVVTVLKGRI